MRRYRYRARERDLTLQVGVLQAESPQAAARALSERGWFAVEVLEDASRSPWWRVELRREGMLALQQQAVLARQLADLLAAGVSAVAALELIEARARDRHLRERLGGISDRLRAGQSVSAALSAQGRIFPPTILAVLQAGEASGSLDTVLAATADLLEQRAQLATKLRQSLTYPAIVAIASVLTLGVLFGFLLPRIAVLYEDLGQTLPLPTRILLGTAGILHTWWPVLVITLVVAVLVVRRQVRGDARARARLEQRMLRMPGPGRLLGLSEQIRFAKTLGTLLAGGVPAVEALTLCESVLATRYASQEITRLRDQVAAGAMLADAFDASELFSGELAMMVRVGEEAGTLPVSLDRASVYLDRQLQSGLVRFTALLEPALIATLALVVGLIVLSMMLPVFELDMGVR